MNRAVLFVTILLVSCASFCHSEPIVPEAAQLVSEAAQLDRQQQTITCSGELSNGQSFYAALLRKGIPRKVIREIIVNMAGVFDFRTSSIPGDQYMVTMDKKWSLISFKYQVTPLEVYVLKQDENKKWQSSREHLILDKYLVRLSGKVQGSLYSSINRVAEGNRIGARFINIFDGKVNFRKLARPGDSFSLMVEKYYHGEEFIGYGKILAAEYQGSLTGEQRAYYFKENEYIEDYYSPEGVSLRPKPPLHYKRISSGFTTRRLHPVLGYFKPHLAIDFAAPTGTPVWAAADGTLIYQGFDNYNGNQIQIEHENGFVSYYNHLSRFVEHLKTGDQISQRQLIGYVGNTGLSTGPHLDYRVTQNGRFINPLKANFPPAPSVAEKEKHRFNKVVKTYLALLQNNDTPDKMLMARVDARSLTLSHIGPLTSQPHAQPVSLPLPGTPALRSISLFHADQRLVPIGRQFN